MSRKLYIDTTASQPSSAFVKSFTAANGANPPVIARSDSFVLELHFLAQSQIARPGQPFVYVDPAAWSGVRFAMGPIGGIPNSGTFTLTSSLGGTTGNLAYNAPATGGGSVQTALQGLTGLPSATVTSTQVGTWLIDSKDTANPTLAITGVATALSPSGSTVQITKTQTATATIPGLTNQWTIQVLKALPVLNTTWSPLASVLVTVTTVQVGSSTANKTFRVVWNADAYFGGVLLSFFDGTNTFTVGPIAYNAAPSDVTAAFLATGVGNGVTVVQNNLGDFTIACTGTSIMGSVGGNNPTLATSSNTLIVPVGLQGVVTASTAGVDSILNGATSATTYCEIEITRLPGEPETIAQVNNAVLLADLLGNTPGFQTGGEDWATIGDVEQIAEHIFANDAARIADTPYRAGQIGYQLDTGSFWIAGSTAAGDWSSAIETDSLIVGLGFGSPGHINIYNDDQSFYSSVMVGTLSGNRTLTAPDISGTIMVTGGPTTVAYVAKTGTYTTIATDGTVNCTSGTFTVTLLTAVGPAGLTQVIKNSGAGTITVNTTSSQTIDGSLTQTLSAKQSITVQSDGANWIII